MSKKEKRQNLKVIQHDLVKKVFVRYPGLSLTLFYMGFWRYVNTWGGDQNDPPLLKSIKMIQTWKKACFGKN